MSTDATHPLISAHDLLARIDDPRLRIADVRWYLGEPERGRSEYRAGHLPRAVFVDLERDLSAASGPGRHPLPDPVAFADRMGELGFGDEHAIVVYDGVDGRCGARLWWMLERLGHHDVAMLDGGITAWTAAGGPLTTIVPTPLRSNLTPAREWPGVIDRDGVRSRASAIDLIDVRAGERYRGETEPVDSIAGHIPGARNRPCELFVDDDGTMLPPERLRDILRGDGADAERPTVVSCGSGVTACFGALAHRVAGLEDPVLYAGSYSDWVAAGLPVVVGDEPWEPRAG